MAHNDRRRSPTLKALILRVYVDDDGVLRGRIDDPATETRTPFAGSDELLDLIAILAGQADPPERNVPCD